MKLLFDKPKKTSRKKINPIKNYSRSEYYDIEYIKNELEKFISLEDFIKVTLIRRDPLTAYRAITYKKWNSKRPIKEKNGNTLLLSPGLYPDKSYWIEKISHKDFKWSPALPEDKNENA